MHSSMGNCLGGGAKDDGPTDKPTPAPAAPKQGESKSTGAQCAEAPVALLAKSCPSPSQHQESPRRRFLSILLKFIDWSHARDILTPCPFAPFPCAFLSISSCGRQSRRPRPRKPLCRRSPKSRRLPQVSRLRRASSPQALVECNRVLRAKEPFRYAAVA